MISFAHNIYTAYAHRIRQNNTIIAQNVQILALMEKVMVDLGSLAASVSTLETDVSALKAAPSISQADIDALTARIQAVSAEVVSLTPVPAPAA